MSRFSAYLLLVIGGAVSALFPAWGKYHTYLFSWVILSNVGSSPLLDVIIRQCMHFIVSILKKFLITPTSFSVTWSYPLCARVPLLNST